MSNIIEVERFSRGTQKQSFSGYIATSPTALANAAREHIRLKGAVPHGFLPDDIERSWRRSLDAGVQFNSCLSDCLDTPSNTTDVLNAHELLVQSSIPEMDTLSQYFGDRALLLLASAEAHVLHVQGGKDILDTPLGRYLRLGITWQEDMFGTNALGTVIVERKPVHLNLGEHYLEPLASYACSAVPISDAYGQLSGVLDITRSAGMSHSQDTLGLMMYAARNIESRLFQSQFAQYTILAFHTGRHYLRSSCQGLLAVDDRGHIVGINQPGCLLLGQERQTLIGLPLETLFQQSLTRLLDGCRQDIGQRMLPLGKIYYEFVNLRRRPLFSGVSQSRPSADDTPAEYELHAMAPSMQRSFVMATKALDQAIPVLLLGETGTGKEVAAQTLHNSSQRRGKPFVAVNCAAIPENLIESELFGYCDGAFTGARKGGMKGRLLQANGGTLFLDEIGDMPLELQARLLRVLQERKVLPLGGGEEQALDVQLIGATHRQLSQRVAEGLFREDLYYRLNGVTITLPALRERSDFCRLVESLMARQGRTDVSVESSLMARLKHYPWPGNIRQLQMMLQVALAFMEADETLLTEEHLTPDFLSQLSEPPKKNGSLQESEASLIRQTLDKHDGNVSAAASALGISRATLYRKLKGVKYG